jgi:four helix bundle protein
MAGFRDLKAWQVAVRLASDLYDLSENWPQREQFGLTSQARRAAVSISANIAEGQGRASPKEFNHHLSIACGSLCELQTLLHIARLRTYCNAEQEEILNERAEETARLIRGLMKSLEPAIAKSSRT